MKYSNKILEAILRGINLAVDDLDDLDTTLEVLKKARIKDDIHIKDILSFVDLGLPSGTLWAKYNLGVNPKKLNNHEDWVGDYYAWGEITPVKKKTVLIPEFKSYKWFKIEDPEKLNHRTFLKYMEDHKVLVLKYNCNKEYGNLDNKSQLELEDDAAYINMTPKIAGYSWRIPTMELFNELRKYCKYRYKERYNGIDNLNGMLFISKKNKNELFLPFGYFKDLNVYGGFGQYWTINDVKDIYDDISFFKANSIWFDGSRDAVYDNTEFRSFCSQIRPVLI